MTSHRPPTNAPKRKGTKIAFSILGGLFALLVVVVVIGALAGDDSGQKPAAESSELSPEERADARAQAGIPPDPTGEARQGYLDALRAIDPWFVNDKGEQDAVDNGVNQCSSIDSDRAVYFAQQRFGKGDIRPVTEAEAEKINAAVSKYICAGS